LFYYTYAEMPVFHLLPQWFGLGRNHYDRVVHFLFGFLVYPDFGGQYCLSVA
jgi:putative membrane protein